MTCLIQESLVRMEAPKFDANLIKSVAFIAKFKVTVYEKVYLKNIQNLICLMKHIKGETKRAFKIYLASKLCYKLALKKTNYMFGQKFGKKVKQISAN